jgi:hypothetical protein
MHLNHRPGNKKEEVDDDKNTVRRIRLLRLPPSLHSWKESDSHVHVFALTPRRPRPPSGLHVDVDRETYNYNTVSVLGVLLLEGTKRRNPASPRQRGSDSA